MLRSDWRQGKTTVRCHARHARVVHRRAGRRTQRAARKSSAGKGSCQSCLMVEERQASVRVVAVLGDANKLTARRSTAARSAFNLHALLDVGAVQSAALCSGLLAAGKAAKGTDSATGLNGLLLSWLTIELTCVRRLAEPAGERQVERRVRPHFFGPVRLMLPGGVILASCSAIVANRTAEVFGS
jgi:hypothetical protein